MASVDVEDVGEAVFTLSFDGVIVGQEWVQSRTDHTFIQTLCNIQLYYNSYTLKVTQTV